MCSSDLARLYDEGALPPPDRPRDLEENLWRALRWGMDRPLIDLATRRTVPVADRIRALLDACAPEIDRLALGDWLVPLDGLLAEGDHASRWKRRVEGGEDMSDVHAEQVRTTMTSAQALKERIGARG